MNHVDQTENPEMKAKRNRKRISAGISLAVILVILLASKGCTPEQILPQPATHAVVNIAEQPTPLAAMPEGVAVAGVFAAPPQPATARPAAPQAVSSTAPSTALQYTTIADEAPPLASAPITEPEPDIPNFDPLAGSNTGGGGPSRSAAPSPPVTEPEQPVVPPVTEPEQPVVPPVTEPEQPVVPPVAEPEQPAMPPVTEPGQPAVPPVTEPEQPVVPPVTEPEQPAVPPVTEPEQPVVPPVADTEADPDADTDEPVQTYDSNWERTVAAAQAIVDGFNALETQEARQEYLGITNNNMTNDSLRALLDESKILNSAAALPYGEDDMGYEDLPDAIKSAGSLYIQPYFLTSEDTKTQRDFLLYLTTANVLEQGHGKKWQAYAVYLPATGAWYDFISSTDGSPARATPAMIAGLNGKTPAEAEEILENLIAEGKGVKRGAGATQAVALNELLPEEAPVLPVETPDAPAVETPDAPAVETPDAPAAETPDAPAVEAPDAPAVETPDAPAVETPDAPAVETPDAPAVETPDAPAVETPDAPAAETPDAPAAETPDAPAVETPDAPAVETPDAPAVETPDAPAAETPDAPAAETPAPAAEQTAQ